jgi:hypothetical protein
MGLDPRPPPRPRPTGAATKPAAKPKQSPLEQQQQWQVPAARDAFGAADSEDDVSASEPSGSSDPASSEGADAFEDLGPGILAEDSGDEGTSASQDGDGSSDEDPDVDLAGPSDLDGDDSGGGGFPPRCLSCDRLPACAAGRHANAARAHHRMATPFQQLI